MADLSADPEDRSGQSIRAIDPQDLSGQSIPTIDLGD